MAGHLPVPLLAAARALCPEAPVHPLAHSRAGTGHHPLAFCIISLFSAGSLFLQLLPRFSLAAKLPERVVTQSPLSHSLFLLEPTPIRLLALKEIFLNKITNSILTAKPSGRPQSLDMVDEGEFSFLLEPLSP